MTFGIRIIMTFSKYMTKAVYMTFGIRTQCNVIHMQPTYPIENTDSESSDVNTYKHYQDI